MNKIQFEHLKNTVTTHEFNGVYYVCIGVGNVHMSLTVEYDFSLDDIYTRVGNGWYKGYSGDSKNLTYYILLSHWNKIVVEFERNEMCMENLEAQQLGIQRAIEHIDNTVVVLEDKLASLKTWKKEYIKQSNDISVNVDAKKRSEFLAGLKLVKLIC